MGFKRMSKMETTEPSVDEVGKGMKKGGKAKMADGGMPMGALQAASQPAMAARRPIRRPGARQMMEAAAMQAAAQPMARKNGGSIRNEKDEIKRVKDELKSNRKEERNEHEEIGRVKKELKSHEAMKASKAHKGLKKGGVAKYATGGVVDGQGGYKKGGMAKYATGSVVKGGPAGYKDGGHCAMKTGGDVGFKAMKKGGCW